MAIVDQAEIDRMKSFMEAMNAASDTIIDETEYATEFETETLPSNEYLMQTKPYSGLPPDGASVDDMKAILERMNSATQSLIMEAESPVSTMFDKEALKEALVTERTPLGVRIGKWEIVVNEGHHKTFDVVGGGTVIASNLYLYDAALALTKALNKGLPINDSRVQKILQLEERYAKNRNDAVVFRETHTRALKKGDDVRAAIAEDRLDEAKNQLSELQEQMLRLAGLR